MSADVRDSGFEDSTLTPDEFLRRQFAKMQTLMPAEEQEAEGGPVAALRPSQASTKSAYEKLQALARAESASDDAPPPAPIDLAEVAGDLLGADDDAEDDGAYEIEWRGGQLGLLFKADAAGRAVIRRVNKKGAAAGLHYARAGDVLSALNGAPVDGALFLDVIAQLKDPQFPVTLEFRPLQLAEVAGVQGPLASVAGTSPTASSKTVDMTRAIGAAYDGSDKTVDSIAAVSNDASAQGEDDEYDVVWDEGPLGCELKQRNGLPTVKAVTGTGTTLSVAQIAAGDILVSINGLKTEEIGFKSTVTLMMRAAKPVYLRFYRAKQERVGPPSTSSADGKLRAQSVAVDARNGLPAPLEPQQYTVLWKEGPLGIQIRTSSKGHVVVSRLTGAGDPAQLDQVAPGDIFVRIAGVEVDALGIAGAFDLLKSVKKPVVLVFQKRRSSSHRNRRQKDELVGGAVPSFRRLREEWAQQQQGGRRPPIQRSLSSERDDVSSWSRLERARGGPMRSFAASYAGPSAANAFGLPPPDCDAISEGGISQRSFDPSDFSGDFPSPRNNAPSVDADAGGPIDDDLPPPPAYSTVNDEDAPTSQPPAFTDAVPNDDDDPTLVSIDSYDDLPPVLPPPPMYTDIFTQSGRIRGMSIPPPIAPPPTPESADFTTNAAPPAVMHSPRSDVYSISSESMPTDYHQNPFGGAPPPSFDMGLPLPPPPEYTSGQGISNARTRLQELRRQYIESERMRNQFNDGYSFSDDNAGLDFEPVPAPFDLQSDAAANLPAPELCVRWSEGPLGITFKRKHGRIVVSRLTGQGYSPGLTQLRPGDWLVSFNGRPTQDLRLGQTMELLKREPKPVDMSFVVQ